MMQAWNKISITKKEQRITIAIPQNTQYKKKLFHLFLAQIIKTIL